MQKGSTGQYIIKNWNIHSFIQLYDSILTEYGFKIKERNWIGHVIQHKAILGDKANAYIVSGFVPFGSLLKEGNRYGAEAQISQYGQDVLLRLLVVPYMALWDRHDVFFLTQGILEKMADDDRCREILAGLTSRIMAHRIEIYRY